VESNGKNQIDRNKSEDDSAPSTRRVCERRTKSRAPRGDRPVGNDNAWPPRGGWCGWSWSVWEGACREHRRSAGTGGRVSLPGRSQSRHRSASKPRRRRSTRRRGPNPG